MVRGGGKGRVGVGVEGKGRVGVERWGLVKRRREGGWGGGGMG